MNILAAATGISSFFQLISVLLIFVFVLFITAWTTKWIAGYQKQSAGGKNLQVVETMKLTTNKYIQIVKAGDTYLVIGIGKDEITMLTTLTEDQLKELPADAAGGQTGENFQEILDKIKQHLPNKQA